MCRHLAYLGPPRTLADLVVDQPHALYEQSWAPARQSYGTVNADGFGAGWYVDGRAEPVRYRRAQPIWTDASFASLAPTVSSSCVVAAVRSGTPGCTLDESGAAPFTHGRWLLSHNGRLADWAKARSVLPPCDVPEASDAFAAVDSALLFGRALSAWTAGASLADGLVTASREVLAAGGGRLSMIAADGTSIAGVVVDEPLWVREPSGAEGGVFLAAEPHDDGAWRELADGTVVHVGADGISETTL